MGRFESRSRPRTAAAVAAVLGTVVFTLSVPGGPVPSLTRATAPVTLRHARQCADVRRASARTMVVPVVVDTGGSSDTAEVACVSVPVGSNGAQVLAARAKLLGVPAPRYAESGLLCAIDGYPATGCGVENDGHYAYWAYYHGGSSWSYASVGPASWKVVESDAYADVEGWRFQPEGSATPADPPPRAPSEASTLCPSSPPPTTTTTAASPPTTTTTPSPPASTAPGSSGGRPNGGTTPAPVTKSSGSKTAASGSGGKSSASTTRPGTAPTTTAAAPATTVPRGDVIEISPSGVRTPRRLAAAHHKPGPNGSPLWIYIGIGVVGLLAAAAAVRTRLTKAE